MVEIREVKEMEITRISEMEKAIFSDAWSQKALLESWSQDHTYFLGAWKNEQMAGYIVFYKLYDEGEIARIAVHKDFRRQGIAGELVCELKKYCENTDILKILLEVREGNHGAISFYHDQGFAVDGVRKGYYSNPKENAVLMSLEIGRELP